MTVFKISLKSLLSAPLTLLLNVLLVAFGTAILIILLLTSRQINAKLENNARDIDVVVGAKGSPLQLVLSSIYYVDFPTGNIPLKDAMALAANPMVRLAVPLALGDNYNGFRIVGTDSSFIRLYGLKLAGGKFWKEDFEVVVGAGVATAAHLKVGDRFYGAHGLSGSEDVHRSHAYRITGVLAPQQNVADRLVLTNVSSVWRMHEREGHAHQYDEGGMLDHGQGPSPEDGRSGHHEREITSLLIQYRSPMSVVTFPRMVNQSTHMQAASPAMESARLFSLIGVGVDTLQWFALLIMGIATLSVFVSLYSSLKGRTYDIALMRSLGASRSKVFGIIILEGSVITLLGAAGGLFAGHLALELIGYFQESAQAKVSGAVFVYAELYIVLVGLLAGVTASAIPAFQAYKIDISKVLAKG